MGNSITTGENWNSVWGISISFKGILITVRGILIQVREILISVRGIIYNFNYRNSKFS